MIKGSKHSEQSKEKSRQSKLKNPTRYWLGKKRSLKTIEKISKAKIGKPSWNKGTKGIMKANRTSFKKGEHNGIEFGKGRRMDGEHHYNWQGGKSFESYGMEFNKELKKLIKIRDEFICQECGKNEYQIHHHIHHIDYDKKNNNQSNLITLCRSCHIKTNFKRNDWKFYFQKKVIAAAETKRSNSKADRRSDSPTLWETIRHKQK